MDLDFQLEHADEEMRRVSIETKRWWTWMVDKSEYLCRYEEFLSHENPSLAFHIRLQRKARERFDRAHRKQLQKLVQAGMPAEFLQHGRSLDRTRHEAAVFRIAAPLVEGAAEEDGDVEMSDAEEVEVERIGEAEEVEVDDGEDIGEEAIADSIAAVVDAAN
uniref:Uncharacterized protein n=1 Tax=Mycena chlorophos TaxID=658473 RepID=A0ABQ0L4F1_MYCCL|nr:predicted protein [Mycena chlorophos]